jgi:hypothetical protein
MARWIRLALAALFASTIVWGSSSLAQEVSKDEDLEKFLQKVDDTKKPEPTPPAAKPARPDSAKKEATAKPSGDVSTKDKDLDNFLEKLGESKETPSPDDTPREMPKPFDEPDPTQKPDKPAPDTLKDNEKEIDQHLEELTGRRHKKKNQDEGEGTGPLSKVIKEMREVEERLGKPDTGDETRKKQTEIVKHLDQLIEQLRSSKGSGKGKRVLVMMPGQKPGQQPGQQPGTTGGNAPHAQPEKPTKKRALAGGKDEWGHLPPELRQEMDNVFKEEGLPAKEDLIRRYYLSLSKKASVRGE